MAKRILRPMGYADILDEVFDLYRNNFWVIVATVAVAKVPHLVLYYATMDEQGRGFMSWLFLPFYAIEAAAIIWVVSTCYLNRSPSVMQAYKTILPLCLPIVFTYLLRWVIGFAAMAALIIPGILLFIYFACTTEVVVLEKRSYFSALKRSYELVSGHWMRALMITVLSFVISLAMIWAVTLPVGYMVLGKLTWQVYNVNPILTSINTVAGVLTAPITAIASVLLYYDLRVRKEGFDVERLAADMSRS